MVRSTSETPARERCPICGAPTVHAYWPFCSRRCADVDLARWLRGAYAIPGEANADEDGDNARARRQGPAVGNEIAGEDK